MCKCNWRRGLCALSGALVLLLTGSGAVTAQDLGSHVTGLVAFDFSTDYITPRGLHVEDDGVVGQPLMLLFWKLYASDQGAIENVTLTTGVWNSFHSHQAGLKPSRWNEIDPILGLTLKLKNKLAIDATMTAFYTPTDSYATSGHTDFKVTYNDDVHPGFSVNPYAEYWIELDDKATVVFDPATSSRGSYLNLGATPKLALAGAAQRSRSGRT